MSNYSYFQGTRQGGRNENQDSIGSIETKFGLLVAVCDGMGGANGGSTASKLSIETIISAVSKSELSTPGEVLTDAIKKANEAIYVKSLSTPELRGMGTTVVALLINEECATTAHVGDSRIYQIRGGRKVFRTFDHSMVFELVRRGRLSEEQARLSAESNVILRALGTKPEVEIELNEHIPYQKGDRFLLCSDGISGAVSEKELCRLIIADRSVERTIEIITETIDKIGIENGGNHDNLSAVLVELSAHSKLKGKTGRRSQLITAVLALLLCVSGLFNGIILQNQQKNKRSMDEVKAVVVKKEMNNQSQRDTIKVSIENKNQRK